MDLSTSSVRQSTPNTRLEMPTSTQWIAKPYTEWDVVTSWTTDAASTPWTSAISASTQTLTGSPQGYDSIVIHEILLENALSDCRYALPNGYPLIANSDVSGLGVILAFLLTAWLVMLGVLVAYLFGLLPPLLLNAVDREVYHRRPNNTRRTLRTALEKATLVASDQQIFTGIAVLVAAFCNFSSLSAYHWQTITYLGWMSSSVHLSTLTVLRAHFRRYPRVRTWRIMAMLVLAVLLAIALAPSLSGRWTGIPFRGFQDGMGIPAHCFLGLGGAPAPFTIFSYLFLCISYPWTLLHLYEGSDRVIRLYLRSYPECLLESAIVRELTKTGPRHMFSHLKCLVLLYVYFNLLVLGGFLESFSASFWFLVGSLVWGTVQLAPWRVSSSDSQWTFGQILPCVLLIQPLATLIQHYLAKDDSHAITHSDHGIPTYTSGIDPDLPKCEPTDTTPDTLAGMLRIATLRGPAEKARSTDVEPHIHFIYKTRLFKGSIWTVNAILLIEWSCACYFFSHINPSLQVGLLMFLGPTLIGGAVCLYFTMTMVGMLFSKSVIE